MRLKNYTANTMTEAMELVRTELGNEAIIISTENTSEGFKITAALEAPSKSERELSTALGMHHDTKHEKEIRDALSYHNIADNVLERLINAAKFAGAANPTLALAASFEQFLRFSPLPTASKIPLLFFGTPGCGKSTAIVKIAAQGKIHGRKIGIITTDIVKAGANEQLTAFANILEIDLVKAKNAQILNEECKKLLPSCDLLLIDTSGINPFNPQEVELISMLKDASNAEPIMVMSAGGDSDEAVEAAQAMAPIEADKMISTRLDLSRRLGSVISVADICDIAISEVSINSGVSSSLCPVSPMSLARLILPLDDDYNKLESY